MKQIVHLALLKRGIMLSRADALLDLCKVKNFYFDKTGTLEAIESSFSFSAEGAELAIPYLNALAEKSKHPILRGLGTNGELKPIQKIIEHSGKGIEAEAEDGTQIIVGRGSFLNEKGIRGAGDSLHPYVSLNGAIVGQILVKKIYDSNSLEFLKKLLRLGRDSKIEILSGDPLAGSGNSFTNLDGKISYQGNLAPEEKAERIQESSMYVGDGLNDTLALAKASVSFRIGQRIIGFAPVDFHLQSPNLSLILDTIQYSKKYRRVLIQTTGAAFIYNIAALTLAAFGKFSPLGAVLSMFFSFSLMLLSVSRLVRVPEVQ
jgi:Cu2+-exporting ATPase